MSSKIYSGSNKQSDKHAARALTQCFFKDKWDSLGYVFHTFWISLLLSPWNADQMYDGSIEDMFFNVLVAYYLGCCNVALLQEKHGSKWDLHFIPEKTFVNAMMTVGQFVGRCLEWPADVAFMPSKTREIVAEIHFSRVKSPCRGLARTKDMIYGSPGPFNVNKFVQSAAIPYHSPPRFIIAYPFQIYV